MFEKLKSYGVRNEVPVYLIDFLLDHSSDGGKYHRNINGISFHKLIKKELYKDENVPSLFITNAANTNMTRVRDYCEEIGDRTKCDFEPKPDDWNDESTKRRIIEFITQAYSSDNSEFEQEIERLRGIKYFPTDVKDNGKSLFDYLDALVHKEVTITNQSTVVDSLKKFTAPFTALAIEDFIKKIKNLTNGE